MATNRELGTIDPNTGLFIPADLRSRDIASASQTAAPSVTAVKPPSLAGAGATSVSNAIGSIIRTGSAAPLNTAGLAEAASRRAAGTANATDLANLAYAESQGWKETTAPTGTITGSITAPTTTPITAPTIAPTTAAVSSRIPGLRTEAEALRKQAFEQVYGGVTAEEFQNLDPAAQRRLRSQRVQGLVGALGNVNDAINFAIKEEEDAKADTQLARENALETLETYLKYGVTDSVPEDQLNQLATAAGLSPEAFKEMASAAEAGEPPELREVGGNLYSLSFDPESGEWISKLVQSKPPSGDGGGLPDSYEGLALALANGEIQLIDLILEYKPEIVNQIKTRAAQITEEAAAFTEEPTVGSLTTTSQGGGFGLSGPNPLSSIPEYAGTPESFLTRTGR